MMRVCQTFTAGVNPAEMSITPDGRWGYVADSNNYGIEGRDTVTVLDLRRGVPLLTISDASFVEPYRIAIDKCGRRAYVCNSGSPRTANEAGTVTIIDIASNRVVGIIPGFDGPGSIAISGNIAYVTNYGGPGGLQSGNGKTVSVVDLRFGAIVQTIEVPQAPAAVIVSPCGTFVYVLSYVDGIRGTGVLSVVRRKAAAPFSHKRIVQPHTRRDMGLGHCDTRRTAKYTTTVPIAHCMNHLFTQINIRSTTTVGNAFDVVVATIPGFFGPFNIVASPCGCFAYVTNFGSNDFAPFGTTVAVVDLRLRKIVQEVEVGIQPSGIAISPDGHSVYVSNYNALYARPHFEALTAGEGTVNVIAVDHQCKNRTKTPCRKFTQHNCGRRMAQVLPPTLAVAETPASLTISPTGDKLYVCHYEGNVVTGICLDDHPRVASRK